MSTTYLIVLLILLAAVAIAVLVARKSAPSESPGLTDGQLTPCPSTPNCVCSEFSTEEKHRIEPFQATGADPMASLRTALIADGAKISREQTDYLAATYASKFFGFVDDVEFRHAPAEDLIHVRSASRAGRSDFGVNRGRVERLRIALARH